MEVGLEMVTDRGGAGRWRYHGGDNGGRSQGEALAESPGETWGLTDEGGARMFRDPGEAERLMDQGDTHSLKATGGAAGLGGRGEDGGSADRGDGGGIVDDGKPEGRRSQMEPLGWRVEAQSETGPGSQWQRQSDN